MIRVLALVFTFIKKISKNIEKIRDSKIFKHDQTDLAKCLENKEDKYILTTKTLITMNSKACEGGKVVALSNNMLKSAMYYFSHKSSLEVKKFVKKSNYVNISKEVDEVLYYVGRTPPPPPPPIMSLMVTLNFVSLP